MVFSLRRVVTGHDENGKAIVKIDEVMTKPRSNRPGNEGHGVWGTDIYPANLNTDADGKAIEPGPPGSTASKFRVTQYSPGVTSRMHRTHSLDYVVIMKGEIDMAFDDGVIVHLKEGDVCVQHGTIHNWVNNGTEPCVVAFILLAADPIVINGKDLEITG
ncbi:MAG: cupin domain-containing protein [Nitrospinota bacterium]